jgi:hypothetical protein
MSYAAPWKINGPLSTHGSFADPSDEIHIIQRKPREISRNKKLLFRPELGLPGAYIFPLYHWDIYRKTPARQQNIMSPAIAAALILPAISIKYT